jgi:hypothetical protein
MNPVQIHNKTYKAGDRYRALLLSDLHWDNPKCDRDLLKRDLDYALERDWDIFINGDLFCAMQGRYDGRRMKADVRPEHNTNTYLDALVDTAVDWFTPYAKNIKLIGYGNHETAILKNCETDLLQRLAHGLNVRGNTVELGGYGGWVVWSFRMESGNGMAYRMKYFHGSGGGGPVTRGVIQNQRMLAQVHGADCVWMGHVHESYAMVNVVESLNNNNTPQLKEVLQVRTPCYKEEYGDGTKGWHIMRGAPPKPLGAYVLDLRLSTKKVKASAYPLVV